MPESPTQRRARRPSGREVLLVAGAYASALVLVAGFFVAYRIHVHHATLAQRSFF